MNRKQLDAIASLPGTRAARACPWHSRRPSAHWRRQFVTVGTSFVAVVAFLVVAASVYAPPVGPAEVKSYETAATLPSNQLRNDFYLQAFARTAIEFAKRKSDDAESERRLLEHLAHLRQLETTAKPAAIAEDDPDPPTSSPPPRGGPAGPVRLYRYSEGKDSGGGETVTPAETGTKIRSGTQPPSAPPITTEPSIGKRDSVGPAKKRSLGGPAGPAILLDENLVCVGRDVERFVDSGLRGAALRQAVMALLKQRGLL